MADEFEGLDFNPDFSDIEEEIEKIELPDVTPKMEATVVRNDDNQSITLKHLVSMTQSHIEDDARVKAEIDELTGIIDGALHQMTIKEMLEYLKIKIREREFHTKCIFDAYNFVQRSEIAKEMLIGSERKERVMKAMDNTKLTKIMGYLNMNNKQEK